MRIAGVLADCAFVEGPDVVLTLRGSNSPRSSRASGIDLLHDCGDIEWVGCVLWQCRRELLVQEENRVSTSEDGDGYETMMDLSHRRTSGLMVKQKLTVISWNGRA
jgi:hypothetical protein